ncbi:glycosyltransferase family 2 protein [Vibrio rarus]|uniref:glycosyltransferase family 2 protein n=1 Tax=Vibrio rarus TaxID=413403 RepID=UPI0021C470DE|nr:glycosyltransferase family 2 protein [Vibrio rarus]
MIKIAILLSTYNGEEFIKEQLQSILDQDTDFHVDIHVRDDGSKDGTVELIREMNPANTKVYQEQNVGVIDSFFELISMIDDYDYYFLCDQDDVWFKNKISTATQFLTNDNSKLYCSALEVVDKALNPIKIINQRTFITYKNSLIESGATGCTMAFTNEFRTELLSVYKMIDKKDIIMHDSLIIKVASLLGNVSYDTEPRISYRQHDRNVIGASSSGFGKTLSAIKNLFDVNKRNLQIKESLSIINCLNKLNYDHPCDDLFLVRSGFFLRLKFLAKNKYYKRNRLSSMIFKLFVFIGVFRNA